MYDQSKVALAIYTGFWSSPSIKGMCVSCGLV